MKKSKGRDEEFHVENPDDLWECPECGEKIQTHLSSALLFRGKNEIFIVYRFDFHIRLSTRIG
jgi:hypothetical protein